jgi:uncharacterized protein YndB with AHSA1/START domain
MSQNRKHHATISLERFFPETPRRVFAEFADPVARARWSAPAGDALIYDESDFKVGGRDVFRCGPTGDLKFRAETRYLVIVPDTCVISSETLETEGQLLAVSLNTLEIEPSSKGATLRLTIQIASSVGEGMAKGYESGNKSALEGLAAHLANSGHRE